MEDFNLNGKLKDEFFSKWSGLTHEKLLYETDI
jgi:hypothetical protein